MITYPVCKINIGLHILFKRNDGFHEIESIMQEIPLRDMLEIIPAPDGKFRFSSGGLPVPGDPSKNLVVKAWELMHARYSVPAVHMHLHKIIPMGAGLGGGSSDAAFALKMLNELFSLGLDDEKLEHLAAELGSDCAFFIKGKTQLSTGRGELLSELSSDHLLPLYIQLIRPDVHIPTAQAYAGIICDNSRPALSGSWGKSPEEWRSVFKNDFETKIFEHHPVLAKIKEDFYKNGALYAAMSGSGSAVYGIFQKRPPKPEKARGYFWEGRIF